MYGKAKLRTVVFFPFFKYLAMGSNKESKYTLQRPSYSKYSLRRKIMKYLKT